MANTPHGMLPIGSSVHKATPIESKACTEIGQNSTAPQRRTFSHKMGQGDRTLAKTWRVIEFSTAGDDDKARTGLTIDEAYDHIDRLRQAGISVMLELESDAPDSPVTRLRTATTGHTGARCRSFVVTTGAERRRQSRVSPMAE